MIALEKTLAPGEGSETMSLKALAETHIYDIYGYVVTEFGQTYFVPQTIEFAGGQRAAITPKTDEICVLTQVRRRSFPANLTSGNLGALRRELDISIHRGLNKY